jgi:malate dehydrogenase (oxaloacetate-decarboxylating)(NADP+)
MSADKKSPKTAGHRSGSAGFPRGGRPGKLEINPTKPMATQRDLSLAYSPGVAVPVQGDRRGSEQGLRLHHAGNMVAVISNGTAILGLGNLGALASKPVMEGKSVLFKRFADVDSIDLEVDTEDVDEFINCVRLLGPSFGGINLEDIKAPDCFIIEQRLRELMDIPVFHDDQHGTAIIAAAGLINALHLTGRDIKTPSWSAMARAPRRSPASNWSRRWAFRTENITLCDTKGVIYKGRDRGHEPVEVGPRGQDQGALAGRRHGRRRRLLRPLGQGRADQDMVASMADNPIIFAMANPDPEITPEEVADPQ